MTARRETLDRVIVDVTALDAERGEVTRHLRLTVPNAEGLRDDLLKALPPKPACIYCPVCQKEYATVDLKERHMGEHGIRKCPNCLQWIAHKGAIVPSVLVVCKCKVQVVT